MRFGPLAWLTGVVIIGGMALLYGFVVFANVATRPPPITPPQADGIVVLTGARHRIQHGMKLLDEGHAGRLLISGVNRRTKRTDLERLVVQGRKRFSCCVDLGYHALNTRGNAKEIRDWARRHGFNRLIVVTSNYHMARALAEVARALPHTELVASAVMSDAFRDRAWWLNPKATRLLAYEYVKYLPSAAQLMWSRALSPWSSPSVAGRDGSRPQTDPSASSAARL